MQPEVSIIIPAYNLESYIDACLNSVENQTYTNFEAIVVDDGSKDGTLKALRRHAEQDPRIVVISTPNQGVARARETGILQARGRYICFLDGDDLFMPDMLEILMQRIAENGGYDIVCCDYKRICKTYETPVRHMQTEDMQDLEYLVASLRHAIPVNVWGRLYRRTLFDDSLQHYPLRLGQDAIINIQIGCRKPRVRFIDHIGYGYVQRAGSSNHRNFDIAYCQTFSNVVNDILHQHDSIFNGQTDFFHLLNSLRWYLVYISKSSSTWVGDMEFAQQLHANVYRYQAALNPYYSRWMLLLLHADRYRWMRPVVVFSTTLMRWGTSLARRMAH